MDLILENKYNKKKLIFYIITVLITSARSWVEYTKANVLTRSKELGKITL